MGLMEIDTAAAGSTETEAWALLVGSATLVANTVTLVVDPTLGALNMPPGEIVPLEAVQVTDVFEVLVTLAENC
jgi:hypothetical protein